MKSASLNWSPDRGWTGSLQGVALSNLIIAFGPRRAFETGGILADIAAAAPGAVIIGCSTGGQFSGTDLRDDDVFALAMTFERTRIKAATCFVSDADGDRAAGQKIGASLAAPDLAGVFVLADGVVINGSSLIDGLGSALPPGTPITGGLAGDDAAFKQTFVFGPGAVGSGVIAAVGFYGSAIQIGHGSFGGWSIFGPRRRVTKSSGNVLFEIDGKPVLDLYEKYLGEEEAARLPASALLFPLMLSDPANPAHEVVRTVLSVDRDARSMTFAGDIPEGWAARLMHGVFEELNAGAGAAGQTARDMLPDGAEPDASILISCIGRRLLLGQRITDELDAVMSRLGPSSNAIGFYSYGEISPHGVSKRCDIHNQTMTVTTFFERAA
jgi:hypothetical protein